VPRRRTGRGAARTLVGPARGAARAVQRPIVFSLLIIIAAYIPLLTLERVERRLFTPMAMTVCFALFGSLLLSLTPVPAVATYLLRVKRPASRHRVLEWLTGRYALLVVMAVRHARITVGVAAIIVAGAVWLGTSLGSEFLPQLDEGVIWIRANLPPGISVEKSPEVAAARGGLIREG